MKPFVLADPCRSGHRLKTRGGLCIQCKPVNIAYQLRHDAPGFVYIAGSKAGRLLKIGSSTDIGRREEKLQSDSYGGLSDWFFLFWTKVECRGKVEADSRALLKDYVVLRNHVKDGKPQPGRELLNCGYGKAQRALVTAIRQGGYKASDTARMPNFPEYEFEPAD